MWRYFLILLLAASSLTNVRGEELLEATARKLKAFADGYDGMVVYVERFLNDDETADLTATVTYQEGSALAEYTYRGKPACVEVARPDGYFLLTRADERSQWIPARLKREGPPVPTVVPELAAPFSIDGVPLFALAEGKRHEIRRQTENELEWIDLSMPGRNRHGTVRFSEQGPISESVSILEGRGSLTVSLRYEPDAEGALRVVEHRSRGSDGQTAKTVFTWKRNDDASAAPFRLEHYGLSEKLLGAAPQQKTWFSWLHVLLMIGAVLVLGILILSLRKQAAPS